VLAVLANTNMFVAAAVQEHTHTTGTSLHLTLDAFSQRMSRGSMRKGKKKMARRIGITGRPGVGKSTVVRRLLERVAEKAEKKVGGMLTAEMRERGKRVGFVVEDISTGEKGILAHIREKGPKVGKYGVNIANLERIGVSAIERAVENADIIVIDEVGPMELKSKKFVNAVENAIESDKDMIVTVHWRANHLLVRRIKDEFDMCEVTVANRDALHVQILRSLFEA